MRDPEVKGIIPSPPLEFLTGFILENILFPSPSLKKRG